ncbi:LysM peptidoglycan-binding domain-containing protein [Shimia sediminis]|uniref:LysM peptidoglycan-binding domain-containing protein n=1 Tax=Shimia sediminis TaxID=2497945 RepID=UPI000F8E01B5|nr:LysM peptidoglycan-binding domain-containing protein [Shimia sediminis]
MSKFASFLSGNAVVVGGGAAAVVAVVAVVATGVFRTPEPSPQPEPTPVAQPVPEPEATPAPVDSTPETTAEVAPETTTEVAPETGEETQAPAPTPAGPAFDIVRVEPNGSTLIAGSGAQGAEIIVLLDNDVVANTSTDQAGKFAVFLDIPSADQARVLSLVQRLDGQEYASDATVILAPTPVVVAESAVEPTESPDATDTPETTVAEAPASSAETSEDTTPAETTATEAPAEETAPTVLMADEQGVTVLQGPWEQSPEVMSSVALDAITYSPEGDVELSGRSGQEGFVRVYLDNAPITTSRITEDGNWRTELPDVDTGVYTLRVDEVNQDGDVVSRVETPFKKEEQEVLEASRATDSAATVVTVQPGSTLWAIATDRYGEGVLYVRVFEANRDRIRDPDLIYPGQIFNLPQD